MSELTESEPFDFDARYTQGDSGIALFALGHSIRYEPVLDEDGWDTGERDEVPDDEWVVVCMVGDDVKFDAEISTLTKLDEDAYCAGCGQLGCGWGAA